jgi:hypothetical protein
MGYRLPHKAAAPSTRSSLAYCWEFSRGDGQVQLELHWALARRCLARRVSVEQLLEHTAPMQLAGQPLRTLAPEALFVTLCVHGAKHLWERLAWIVDLSQLLAADPPLSVSKLLNLADRWRVRRMVLLGLLVAHEVLASPLPAVIARQLSAEPAVQQLGREICARLSRQVPRPMAWGGRFYLQVQDSLLDRAACGWALATTPNAVDRQCLALPQPLGFLRYAVRPLRLCYKYAGLAAGGRGMS